MANLDQLEIKIRDMLDKKLTERLDTFQSNINGRFDLVEKKIDKMVSREEFDPIRNIVYGGTTVILVTVLGALLSLVIFKK